VPSKRRTLSELHGVTTHNISSCCCSSSSTSHIRPFGLFHVRINLDSWLDSLDGGSAHRKAATYAGQHKHGINADISCLRPSGQCRGQERWSYAFTPPYVFTG
jgi:hypothetical protein